MQQLTQVLRMIDTYVHKVLLIVAQLALAAMIAIVCITVYYRYVLNSGIIWAEEVPRILVALFAFIACAMGVRDDMHVGISMLYNRFSVNGTPRKALDILVNLATLTAGWLMAYYGWKLCAQLGRFTMPATGWPRWVQYISMPISGIVIIYDSLLFLFGVLTTNDKLYSEPEQEYRVMHVQKKNQIKEGGAR